MLPIQILFTDDRTLDFLFNTRYVLVMLMAYSIIHAPLIFVNYVFNNVMYPYGV